VRPELVESKATVVQAANREQKRLFDFSVRLIVKRPQDTPAAATVPAAAKQPAPALAKQPLPAAAPPSVAPAPKRT